MLLILQYLAQMHVHRFFIVACIHSFQYIEDYTGETFGIEVDFLVVRYLADFGDVLEGIR